MEENAVEDQKTPADSGRPGWRKPLGIPVTEWLIALFTLVIMGSTIAYTTYARHQWKVMTASNQINLEALMISRRAFVYFPGFKNAPGTVEQRTTSLAHAKSAELTMALENSGETPALRVTHQINTNKALGYQELPQDFDFPDYPLNRGAYANSLPVPGTFMLGPHQTVTGGTLDIPLSVLKQVDTGKNHVFVWGWVTYRDIFGGDHKTEFCKQIVDWEPDGNFTWEDYPQHNCVDRGCSDFRPTASGLFSFAAKR